MNFWKKLFGRGSEPTPVALGMPEPDAPQNEAAATFPESKPVSPEPTSLADPPCEQQSSEAASDNAELDARLIQSIKELSVADVRASLADGANPNAQANISSSAGWMNGMAPAIHFALKAANWSIDEEDSCLQILDTLLMSGADIDAPGCDAYGSKGGAFTPLLNAVQMELPKTVEWLLDHGANTSIRTSDGRTASQLCLTSEYHHRDRYQVVKSLLAEATDEGRDWLQSSDGREWTFAHTVDKNSPVDATPFEVTEILRDALRPDDDQALQPIIRWVESGGDMEWRTPNGWTLLHMAAQCGNEKMIRFLLANGAGIESLDETNGTPLMLACNTGFLGLRMDSTIVELLLDSGANPSAEDLDGNTALGLIRRSGSDEAERIAQLLINRGATSTLGKDSPCPECGSPYSADMAKRGVLVSFTGAFAEFVCFECEKRQQVPLESIDKAKGIQVMCSCGATAFIPPSVWCGTCGNGLSTGWQSRISDKG